MNSNVQLKNKAIILRKEGRSYNEIIKEINVAKSTLSNWLKDIQLSPQQNINLNNRLADRVARGRLRTGIVLRAKRIAREKAVSDEAIIEFEEYIRDPFFSIGVSLYWAEGSKKSTFFAFINSDPDMITLMVKWIRRYLVVGSALIKYRLFIHLPYKNENCEEYWAKSLNISVSDFEKTIYKPTPHSVKKNIDYKGCLRISITRINVLRKVIAWQKLLIQYYDRVLSE